ncbi:MAG: hypothetical protein QOC87_751 [Actinomycetota bacterium]|nr:hypothetical protein [Actinomycetota bacterium]
MSEIEQKFAVLKAKQCTSKNRYDSEADAQDAAAAANIPFVSETVSVYKCPWCPGWHIGKSR